MNDHEPDVGTGGGPPDDEMDALERWDADDPRRKHDCFAPPTEPCECWCLHCGRTFSSEGIWFQRIINDPGGLDGFWMCPTPNCDGAGFTFDIFPTDPAHPANAGWHSLDEDEDDDAEEAEFDDEGAFGEDAFLAADPDGVDAPDYDPAEPKYAELDEEAAAFGDIEGEEWKHGLASGEVPPEPEWVARARREREEEQRRYDMPDERPRILDWSDPEDRYPRRPPTSDTAGAEDDEDDDIPF